jgi:hypothetical protein
VYPGESHAIPKLDVVRDDVSSLMLVGGSGLVIRIAPPPYSEVIESPYMLDAITLANTSVPHVKE